MSHGEEAVLRIEKSGLGAVTAADIQTTHDTEIMNPDLVIANLTQVGELKMSMKVEKGRGYQPVSTRMMAMNESTVGALQLDASFSPIRRVSYTVESARVEQRTDLDKLILEIETNGTV